MIKKEEKKHTLLKLTILLVAIFFISMAFIEPKPKTETITNEVITLTK